LGSLNCWSPFSYFPYTFWRECCYIVLVCYDCYCWTLYLCLVYFKYIVGVCGLLVAVDCKPLKDVRGFLFLWHCLTTSCLLVL
ncbi:hypothetical protein HN51_012538, partial [Arachis hypogaea]